MSFNLCDNWKTLNFIKVYRYFDRFSIVSLSALTFHKNHVICFNERPLKMMKNAFYFNSKAQFVLKIFVLTFLPYRKNDLIRKIRIISKLVTSSLVNNQLQYTYCAISHEVNTIRQLNLVSYSNIIREIFFFKHHTENETGKLVPDLFLFLKKALYEVKNKWSTA